MMIFTSLFIKVRLKAQGVAIPCYKPPWFSHLNALNGLNYQGTIFIIPIKCLIDNSTVMLQTKMAHNLNNISVCFLQYILHNFKF